MNRILVHCLLGLRASKWPCPWPVTAETPDPTRVMVDEVAVGQAFCPGICFSPIPVVAWSKLCDCDRSLILMGLWVRIPPRARMFVSCECCASVKEVHGPTANRSATGGEKKKFPLSVLFHNTQLRHPDLMRSRRGWNLQSDDFPELGLHQSSFFVSN